MDIKQTSNSFVIVDSNMRIIPEVLDFTRYLKQKGRSINTIHNYLLKLCVFYEWMELEGYRPYEVLPKDMPKFIQYIDDTFASKEQGKNQVAASTLNGYLSTLATFYKYFSLKGFVEPADYKIKDKRKTKHLTYLKHVNKQFEQSVFSFYQRKVHRKVDKKVLSAEETQHFYNRIGELYESDLSLRIRNQLIFKILYETGMRIGELLHLRISDYDLPEPFKKTGNIYLVERKDEDDKDRQLKSGERTIPVSTALIKEIDDYVMYHRPQVGNCEYIIVNHRLNQGKPPTRRNIEKMFHKVYEECGIQRKVITPHSLRHTHASNLGAMGIDMSVIKARLGHSSISTTAQYVDVSIETLTISFENYLENKKEMGF